MISLEEKDCIWTKRIMLANQDELIDSQKLLRDDETLRAKKFQSIEKYQQFVIARATLRQLLSKYVQQQPQQILLKTSNKGKPYLPEHNFHFNVSHSGDFAIYAFCKQEAVGIDIEKITTRECMPIAKRFFSTIEYHRLLQLQGEEQQRAFHQLWVRKEAVLKAQGQGIAGSMTAFAVSHHAISEEIIHDDQRWFVHPITHLSGYAGAFSSNRKVDTVKFFDV